VVSGERLEAKVLRQLKRALQPVLKQPTIDYATGGGAAVKSHTPNPLPAVFEGERVIAYAFFDTTDTDLYHSLSLSLSSSSSPSPPGLVRTLLTSVCGGVCAVACACAMVCAGLKRRWLGRC
jgi:hypothetical protein